MRQGTKDLDDESEDAKLLVIGGGVAGSTCALELKRLRPSSLVTLVSPSPVIKEVRELSQITEFLGEFEVSESLTADFSICHPDILLLRDSVTHLDSSLGKAYLASGGITSFTRCCVATGASPTLAADHPSVIGIRDTESVEELTCRLESARRVVVLGNGGIALELVHALLSERQCEVVWAVRDDYIGNTFFDATASSFVMQNLPPDSSSGGDNSGINDNSCVSTSSPTSTAPAPAPAQAIRQDVCEEMRLDPPESAQEFPLFPPCTPEQQHRREREGGDSEVNATTMADGSLRGESRDERGKEEVLPVLPCGGGLGPNWVKLLEKKGGMMRSRHGGCSQIGDQKIKENLSEVATLDIQLGCELSHVESGLGVLSGGLGKDSAFCKGGRRGSGVGKGGLDDVDQKRSDVDSGCAREHTGGGGKGTEPGGSAVPVGYPVRAVLTNGKSYDCDFVVSATGVEANTAVLGPQYRRGADGGILVDEYMRAVLAHCPLPGQGQAECGKAEGKGEREGASAGASSPALGYASKLDGMVQESGEVDYVKNLNIYACGDCCCLEWPQEENPHWFQMRLWTQARLSALYTAKCMAGFVDQLGAGGFFCLFAHATRFFGHKVSLLGRFNGQGLGPEVQDYVSRAMVVTADGGLNATSGVSVQEADTAGHASVLGISGATGKDDVGLEQGQCIYANGKNVQVVVRVTLGVEYMKIILVDGRVKGAMLIGDTGLEETFENLILNGTDVGALGADLLSEDIDIEDFFD